MKHIRLIITILTLLMAGSAFFCSCSFASEKNESSTVDEYVVEVQEGEGFQIE